MTNLMIVTCVAVFIISMLAILTLGNVVAYLCDYGLVIALICWFVTWFDKQLDIKDDL